MTQDPTSIPGEKSTRREATAAGCSDLHTCANSPAPAYIQSRSLLGFYFKEKELSQVKMIRGP